MKKITVILFSIVVLIALALGISYLLSGGPTEISNHVTIQRSPPEVFNYISDMRNELKWNPDVLLMEKTSEGPIGLGTTFKAKWHLSDTITVTITEYEPPYKVTFVNGVPIEVTLKAELTATDSGTLLQTRFIATPHGFMRAVFPIFKTQMSAQEKENMVNLKKALNP